MKIFFIGWMAAFDFFNQAVAQVIAQSESQVQVQSQAQVIVQEDPTDLIFPAVDPKSIPISNPSSTSDANSNSTSKPESNPGAKSRGSGFYKPYNNPQDFFPSASEVGWTSDDMRSSHLDTNQMMQIIPGVQMIGGQSVINQSLFIRGAPSEESLILWNGIELNDPAAGNLAANPIDVQGEFSQNLKVYKGPQSLLYGPQGLAGVFDWQKSDMQQSRFWGKAGSLQNQKAVIEVQKKISSSDTTHWTWGLGGTYSNIQGLSSSSDSSMNENDRRTLHRGSGFLEAELGPLTKFEFWGLSSDLRSEDDLFGMQSPTARSSQQLQAGRATIKQKISEKDQVHIQTQNIQSSIENRNDTGSVYLDSSRGEKNKNSFQWLHSQEFNFLFSADSTREDMRADGFDTHQNLQGLSIGASTLNGKYEFGIRLDKLNTQSDEYQNEWSYNFQLRQPLENSTLEFYERYGVGHKFASLYQRFSKTYGNSNLTSEKEESLEVGSFVNLATNEQVQLSLFRNFFSQMISYDYTSSRYQNIGRAETQGVELSYNYQNLMRQFRGSFAGLEAIDRTTGQALQRRAKMLVQGVWIESWTDHWSSTSNLSFLGPRPDRNLQGATDLPQKINLDFLLKYSAARILNHPWDFSFSIENLLNDRSPEIATYEASPRSFHVLTETRF